MGKIQSSRGGDASRSGSDTFQIAPYGCSGEQGRTITVSQVGHATIGKLKCGGDD